MRPLSRLLLGLVIVTGAPAFTDAGEPVVIQVESVEAAPSTEVRVPVMVRNLAGAGAVQFVLSFDPEALEAIGSEPGPAWVGGLVDHKLRSPGVVRIALARADAAVEDGVLLEVRFSATSQPGGPSPIGISETEAWLFESGMEMLVNGEPGAVTIGDPQVNRLLLPAAVAGGALLLLLLVFVITRRRTPPRPEAMSRRGSALPETADALPAVQTAPEPATEPGERLALRLPLGPGQTRDVELFPGLSIGRASANHIQLEDEAVSARHAVIEWDGRTWRVRDLGSTNGTILNGGPVTGEALLTGGDLLRVGALEIAVVKAQTDR